MKKIRILLLLFLLVLLTSCNTSKKITKTYSVFNTYIDITIYDKNDDKLSYATKLINKLNKLCDKYSNYDQYKGVYYINSHQGEEILIDSDLYNLIKLSINKRILRTDTSSYFEIGIGEITDIYKDIFTTYNKETIDDTIFPNDDVLNKDYLTNSSLIELNDELQSIIVPIGMKLDLGGVAKGYLIDLLSDYFESNGIKYLIDAGCSSIKTNTINKTKGTYYTVGLINPINNNTTYKTLKLKENKVLTTSGYYQKYFIYNNKTYSHIIDPLTNLPVETDILSISIITDSGIDGDILSTSLYMMGSIKALEYINSHDGIDAIMYLSNSDIIETDGIKNYY